MNSAKLMFLISVVMIGLTYGCVNQTPETQLEDTVKPESASEEYSVKISIIMEKGGRVDWSHALNVIVFDKKGNDGYYEVYTMNPDGSDEYCLTCHIPGLSHNSGNPAWHPSGEWIVFQSVNTSLIPSYMDSQDVHAHTNPGAGWLNNLWATDSKGEKFYQLTDVGTKGGVLHPHFSHDGSKLLWAEKTEKTGDPGSTGGWELKVADFVTENGPVLENIKSFTPGKQQDFYESHGFSPDDTKILFSSNLLKDQPLWGMDIYELDLKTQALTPLTDTFYQWDEHAQYSPDGEKIVWMSSAGYDMNPLRTEFWIMDCNGSEKQQLTFFNRRDHPHYMGKPIVAADSSWGPDGKTIIAYIKTESAGLGSEGAIVMMELEENHSTHRLQTISRYWNSLIHFLDSFANDSNLPILYGNAVLYYPI